MSFPLAVPNSDAFGSRQLFVYFSKQWRLLEEISLVYYVLLHVKVEHIMPGTGLTSIAFLGPVGYTEETARSKMSRREHYKLLGILGLALIGGASAKADAITCPTASLSTYISSFGNNTDPSAPSNGCVTTDNLQYYGFTFTIQSSTGNSDSANSITVSPDGSGLDFNGFKALVANAGDLEYFIGFNIDPAPPIITGDSISLDPFNAGTATLNLFICSGDTPYYLGNNTGAFECGATYGSGFATGTSSINLASPDATVTTGNPTATFNFPSTSQVGILLELVLNAGTTGTGTGTLGSDPQASSVPEPSSFGMIASGLCAVLLLGKFMKRRLAPR